MGVVLTKSKPAAAWSARRARVRAALPTRLIPRHFLHPLPSGAGIDAVSGLPARYQYLGADFYVRPGKRGPEWSCRNAANYKIYSPYPSTAPVFDGVTTLLIITPYANVTAQQILLGCDSSSWYAATIYIGDGSNPRFGVMSYSGINTFAFAPQNYELRRRYVLMAVSDSNGSRLYIDGVLVASHAVAPGNLTLEKRIFVAGSSANNNYGIEAFGMFPYALDDDEVEVVSDNPWALLASRRSYLLPSLSAGGGSSNLAAAGTDTAAGTAALAASVGLAGVGLAVASGAANATVAIPLAAAGIAQASGAAADAVAITVSAAGLATALGQAAASVARQLAASGGDTASGAALQAVAAALAATGADTASGTATISSSGAGSLAATGGDTASGNAALTIAAALTAAASALAAGNATLSINLALAGAGSDVASGSATINSSSGGSLSATGSDTASGTAAIRAAVQITAAGLAQAAGLGQLQILVPLAAFGGAQAGGSAHLVSAGGVSNQPLLMATRHAPVALLRTEDLPAAVVAAHVQATTTLKSGVRCVG